MRRSEAARDLRRVFHDFGRRQWPASQGLTQRLTLKQLRDDERTAVVHAEVVDGDEVRMAQPGGCTGFELEAPLAVGITRPFPGQDFDSDVAPQLWVSRAIDLTHSARAHGAHDFESSEPVADRDDHAARIIASAFYGDSQRIPTASTGSAR